MQSYNPNIPSVEQPDEETIQEISLRMMNEYRAKLAKFNGQTGNLNNLLEACSLLFGAALLGNMQAELEMEQFPKNKKLMQYEYDSIIQLEYIKRLKKIAYDSELFKKAQIELASIHFNLNQEKIYSSPAARLRDIRRAFYYLFNTPDSFVDPSSNPGQYAEELAITTLIKEMCGESKLSEQKATFCLPFRMQPVKALELELEKLLPHKKNIIKSHLRRYQLIEATNVLKKYVKPEGRKFKLELNLDELTAIKDNVLCFYDSLKGEIARVSNVYGEIKIDINNYDVEIVISGVCDASKLILLNPGSSIHLSGNLAYKNDLLVSGESDSFIVESTIGSYEVDKASLTIEARNGVKFVKGADLYRLKSLEVRADSAIFANEIYAEDSIILKVKNNIKIEPECIMTGEGGLTIIANSMTEMRGKLISDRPIEFYLNDSAYIHGDGLVISFKKVVIVARQLMITDKASVGAKQSYIKIRENLTIEKEASFEVGECDIKSRHFNNYSPNFKADSAVIECADTFTNFSTGVITTTQALTIQGWHCWNGGNINFGKNMKLKLNGLFVHGVADISMEDFRNSVFRSGMTGENLSVVAGVVFNALGYVNVSRFNLTAIVEAGPSFTLTKSMQKKRFLSADLSVNFPNLRLSYESLYHGLSELWKSLAKRELPSVDTAVSSAMSILSLTRWVLDILMPTAIKPIDAAWTLAMALLTMPSIYSLACELYKKNKNGQKIELSDYYELVGSLTSAGILCFNAANQIENIRSEDFDFTVKWDSDKAISVFLSAASVMLPSNIDDSILGFKSGINISGSIMSRSVITYDASIDLGINVSYLFTAAKELGFAAGVNISNTGMKLQNDATQVSVNNFNNVSEEKNAASIYALNEVHAGTNIVRSGNSNVRHITLRASEKYTETKESVTTAESTDIGAKNVERHGVIHGTAKHEAPPEVKTPNPQTKDSTGTQGGNTPEAKDANTSPGTPADEKPKPEPKIDIKILATDNLVTGVDSVIDAPNSLVVEAGDQTSIDGKAHVQDFYAQGKAHLEVKHSADLSAEKSLMLKGATGSLDGYVTADALSIDIDHGLVVKDVLDHHGGYENYKPTSYLGITTQDITCLGDHWFDLAYLIYGAGPTVYDFPYSVHINAPAGLYVYDCKLSTDASFIFTSDGGIALFYTDITAKDKIFIETKGGFSNYGKLSADTVSIIGGQVFNAGILQASTYLQIIANRAVKPSYEWANTATVGNYQGSIVGGSGIGHNNVGLFIDSAGQLINEEGTIFSPSDSDIEADLGLVNKSRDPIPDFLLDQFTPQQRSLLNLEGIHANITSSGKEIITVKSGDIFNNRSSLMSANELSLQDKNGNIINWGGILQAQTYLEAIASGDIINKCYVTNLIGRWSIVQRYEPGYVFGGTGIGHDGVGLFESAGGRIINDASIYSTYGNNYFSGTRGIDAFARHNRYISSHEVNSSWMGDSETTVWTNQVQPAMFMSTHGSNTFYSSAGDINFMSVTALAAVNNEFAAANTRLHSLVLDDVTETSSSSFLGLENSYFRQEDEYVFPTTLENINDIIFISPQGCVEIINTRLVNSGKLTVRAHDLLISATILNHWLEMETTGFNVNFPIASANNITPLFSDWKNLMNSGSGTGWGANAWSLALDSVNSVNGVISGIRNNNLGQTFSPASYLTSIDVSYGRSRMEAHWKSIPINIGVYTGSADLQVSNAITFENAVPIFVARDAVLRAHVFNQYGAELHSTINTESQSFTLGLSVQGGINFGESASGSSTNSTHYQHQIFNVGGTLYISVDEWKMMDANLIASILNAHVGNLTIVSHLDTISTHSWSESLNTNGSFSFGMSSNNSATIGMPSGILTTNGLYLHANVITLQGGKIISHGDSYVSANVINSIPVREYRHGSSFGISGNLHDFFKDPSVAWQQAIPSLNVNIGRQNYEAVQQGTIWNNTGTPVHAQTINGDLNQSSPSGLKVTQNENFNLHLQVPIFNTGGINQLLDNMRWLANSSSTASAARPANRPYNDNLYDSNDEDYFDSDFPPLVEEKSTADDTSNHERKAEPEHRHTKTSARDQTHNKDRLGTLPQIGITASGLYNQRGKLNQLAHEDNKSPKSHHKAGYDGLTDPNNRQRFTDKAFNRSSNSSTQRIFDDFKDETVFEDESKDFANDVKFPENRNRFYPAPSISRSTSTAYNGETRGATALDYVRALNSAVENVKDNVINGVATEAKTAWDGVNAIGEAAFGLTTEEAHERNMQRGKAIHEEIQELANDDTSLPLMCAEGLGMLARDKYLEFKKDDGPARFGVITEVIASIVLGAVTGEALGAAKKANIPSTPILKENVLSNIPLLNLPIARVPESLGSIPGTALESEPAIIDNPTSYLPEPREVDTVESIDYSDESMNDFADHESHLVYNEFGIPSLSDQVSNHSRVLGHQSDHPLGLFAKSYNDSHHLPSNLSHFGSPELPIGDIITPSESLIERLDAFGMEQHEIDLFLKGHEVQFEAKGARLPINCFILFKDNLLSAGILNISNEGSSGSLLRFKSHVFGLARDLGINEVEIFGAKIINKRLEELLIARGFRAGPAMEATFMGRFVDSVPTVTKIFKVPQLAPTPSFKP